MSSIISKRNFGAIDAEDTSCQGYYMIIIYSSPHNLQEVLNIYGQVKWYTKVIISHYNYQLSLLHLFKSRKK